MKITKSKEDVDRIKKRKQEIENANFLAWKKANERCWPCPECGSENIYTRQSGYLSFKFQLKKPHIRTISYTTDKYTCNDCGCEWESEQYVQEFLE